MPTGLLPQPLRVVANDLFGRQGSDMSPTLPLARACLPLEPPRPLDILWAQIGGGALWPSLLPSPCIGIKDTACVDACPVDCIHPKKNTTYDDGRPGFDEAPQLYIDPVECIDCGACVPVLPGRGDFRAGRPTRKMEALHGNKRELRPGRHFHARRVCQAQGGEVDAEGNPNHPLGLQSPSCNSSILLW
jgi:NAD-dependent dihydropyrimidine dehydrogenase PreA subunit